MSDAVALAPQNQPVVDLKSLSPEDLQKAKDIAATIKVDDAQTVIQYGIGAQSKLSGFADTILTEVRAKDTGYVGGILTDLVLKVKDIGVGNLSGEKSFLENIPVLNLFINTVRKFIAKYEKMSVQIEQVIAELDKSRMNLLKDITLLDNLFAKNSEYLKELDLYIAAGQLKLDELRAGQLVELQKKAEETKDPLDAQKLNDFLQFLNRFEKKLHDLKLSRMIALQTGPQIRLIQNNNQALVEKIQSSILNTIPLWKNQIIIAISLFRQKKALEVQKSVTDTTNELLAKNSEMLKTGSLEIAKEAERGIIEIDTLKKVNADLISTIEETLKIQADGRAQRAAAEQELVKMEGELKAKLVGQGK